jgi:hypothetical protein
MTFLTDMVATGSPGSNRGASSARSPPEGLRRAETGETGRALIVSGGMGRGIRAAALVAALSVSGCSELPRSFTLVSLEEVRPLVARGEVEVVEVLEPGRPAALVYPGATLWHLTDDRSLTPDIQSAGALVVGETADSAFRAAAALARSDHDPVYVFIPRTQEERQALVALARREEEATRGEDS